MNIHEVATKISSYLIKNNINPEQLNNKNITKIIKKEQAS